MKKEEKSSKSESDLKKRLLEKQKAKKSKSSAPPNTKGIDSLFRLSISIPADSIRVLNSNLWFLLRFENDHLAIDDKVGVEFYQRLFRIIGIQKDACKGIAKKFYNCSFDPDEKNFKSISMFDFGTKFGVPLAYRNQDSHDCVITLQHSQMLHSH